MDEHCKLMNIPVAQKDSRLQGQGMSYYAWTWVRQQA